MRKLIKKAEKWCNHHEWLIFLILFLIALRVPSLFTPHYYGDEEIYFVMGRAWRTGVPMYEAMFDHKPPLIYMMAGVFNTIYLFRVALMGWMIAHTIIFWKLARLVFAGSKKILPYIASLLFVILNTLPALEGNIVNAELMMMMPITLSLLMVWRERTDTGIRPYRFLLAGLVAGVGWLFKIPVMFDVMAIALYLFVFRKNTFMDGVRGVFSKSFWAYILGFGLPLASTFAYYYLKGHGESYLATVFSVNLSYVSSWETSAWSFNPFRSGLVVRGSILGVFTLLLYTLRKKLDKRLVLVLLWLAFSFFGSLLSARPYPHYLLQPVVPLSLALPMIVITESVWAWIVIGFLSIWGVMTMQQIGFWWYPNTPLYTNFAEFVTGKIMKQEYLETFDGAKRNYKIGEYLNERMSQEDKLFVWGSDAAIYNITKKLPAGGKYIVNFHVHDLGKHEYVMENLRKNVPMFIVVLPGTTEFPQLMELLEREYLETFEVEGAIVYKRVSEVLGRQVEISHADSR